MSVSPSPNEPAENRLLAALPSDEYERLLPRLEQVSFSLWVKSFTNSADTWNMSSSLPTQSSLCCTPWKTARALKWV